MQACNKTLFWGGTYENVCLQLFFFIVFIARLHFDRFVDCNYVPTFYRLAIIFQGGRPILQVAFYGNKCKNMEKMQEQ